MSPILSKTKGVVMPEGESLTLKACTACNGGESLGRADGGLSDRRSLAKQSKKR